MPRFRSFSLVRLTCRMVLVRSEIASFTTVSMVTIFWPSFFEGLSRGRSSCFVMVVLSFRNSQIFSQTSSCFSWPQYWKSLMISRMTSA